MICQGGFENNLVGNIGFEPSIPVDTDLQSAATLQLRRLPLIIPIN